MGKARIFILLCWVVLLAPGCAYRFGQASRTIPGGYSRISIPVFKNRTQEVGAEAYFTRALIEEFQRSKVAQVVEDDRSDVRIEGDILSVTYRPEAGLSHGGGAFLPLGTVIATQYPVTVSLELRVVRRSDGARLWVSHFTKEGSYDAPQVTIAGVNTVNPLYNVSARRQNMERMAADLMLEAHSRITENF